MRYLIVSSDRVYAHHLSALMRGAGQVADIRQDGLIPPPLFARYVQDYALDALVLDLSGLSRTRGGALVRCWHHAGRGQVPVMVIASCDQDVPALLRAGADGCHVRQEDARVLPARLSAMLRRLQGFSSDVLEVPPFRLDIQRRQFSVWGCPIHLTRYELKIMELLMRYRGRVLSHTDILLRLQDEITREKPYHSLGVLIGRMRQKIRPLVATPKAVIRTLHDRGYLLDTTGLSLSRGRPGRERTRRHVRITRARQQGWVWTGNRREGWMN